jgi:hypothetical protein
MTAGQKGHPMRSSAYVITLALALSSSCRIAKVGKDYPDQEIQSGGGDATRSPAPAVQPQQQTTSGQVFTVNLDSAGVVRESLTLRLDYFPAPRADGVSVPTCYNEIAGHLVIARVYCGGNGNLSADVTASQVSQQCFTVTPTRKIDPKTPIQLSGCSGAATLKTYKFEPDIKLEVK